LLVDPTGDGLFVGVFKGVTGAILTAEGLSIPGDGWGGLPTL